MRKKSWKDAREGVVLFTFLFVITFIFMLQSPMHFWIGGDVGTDSAVFKTIAMVMDKGYMPYRDSFDHKGLLLYLINYLGHLIARYRGVWFLEFFTIYFTFYCIYRIGCLFCSKKYAAVVLIISTVPLFSFWGLGNLTEEYAMLFIAASLYIFIDYFLNQNVTVKRLVICGGGFGAVCLLRPNMTAVWIVFCIAVGIDCCKKKKYKDLFRFILWFTAGLGIVTVPVLLWLAWNRALGAFWEQYIVFNGVYCGHAGGEEIWRAFFAPLRYEVILFTFIAALCLYIVQKDRLSGIYVCYLFCSFLMISVAGRTDLHYNMVLIPSIAFPAASLYGLLERRWKEASGQAVLLAVTAVLLTRCMMPDWVPLIQNIGDIYHARNEEHHSERVRTICWLIGRNTEDDDKISVYGNWDIIYLMSDRMHATRYSYQYPIGEMDPKLKEDYFIQLKEEKPKLIVTREDSYDSDLEVFLDENGYDVLWSEKEAWDSDGENALVFICNE